MVKRSGRPWASDLWPVDWAWVRKSTSWLESLTNSLTTCSFKCRPSQARLYICLTWSSEKLTTGTDAEGKNGPTVDEALTGIGALMDEMGWALPSPKSRGGRELRLWLKDRCTELGSGRSEDSLRSVVKGVEWNMGGGGRGQPSGVCDFLQSCGGLALLLRLCLALRLSDGLSCLRMIFRVCYYWYDHLRGLDIVENVHEAVLRCVGCHSF